MILVAIFGVLSALAQTAAAAESTGNVKKAAMVSPTLTIPGGGQSAPRVALTLDACSGKVDRRILDTLVANRIPATLFVTARWLRNNAAAVETLKQNPDLFDLENHGGEHLAAVFDRATVEGVRTVGSADGLTKEIDGGADAIRAVGGNPRWYRGATALYSPAALPIIGAAGYRVAGYSLNADQGASLPARTVARRIAAARDGDVIIAHINQPTRDSGAGVAEGVLALQAKGYRFMRLTETLGPFRQRRNHAMPDG